MSLSASGLGYRPFKAKARVQIPLGTLLRGAALAQAVERPGKCGEVSGSIPESGPRSIFQ